MGFFDALKGAADIAKFVGGAGLELAGAAAKFTGNLVVEGAKDAIFGDDGLGLANSSASTKHEYIAWTLDDLQSDLAYMQQFCDAVREMVRREPRDAYVGAIFRCTGGKPAAAQLIKGTTTDKGTKVTLWRLLFEGIEVRAGDDIIKESRFVTLMLVTPNARQLSYNGTPLPLDKSYDGFYKIQYGKERGSNKSAITPTPSNIDSFLGVKFLADYKAYTDETGQMKRYDTGIGILNATTNKFLDFSTSQIIVAMSDYSPNLRGKVIGVRCVVNAEKIENQREVAYQAAFGIKESRLSNKRDNAYEFIKKVQAILERKYGLTWPCGESRMTMNGEIEGHRHTVCISMFYNADDDSVELKVVVEDIFRSVHDVAYSNTPEYKEKKKRELEEARKRKDAEEKAATEAKARKEKAEKAKRERDEAIAEKKAAINDALDAL